MKKAVALLAGLLLARPAVAEISHSIASAFKATGLYSRAPADPSLYPDRDSGAELGRARLTGKLGFGAALRMELAYEQKFRHLWPKTGAAAGSGLLPSALPVPYRLTQMDWTIARHEGDLAYRHEIDRLEATRDFYVSGRQGQVTLGRQAVGMGRGVFFAASDLFAPFSPTEVDQEWRRGIDAFRAEFPLADTISAGLTAAFGRAWRESALIGRIRGYDPASGGDLAFMAGKRARDGVLALAGSFRAGEASAHFDAAAFIVPEEGEYQELAGLDRCVLKAVAGVSHKIFGGKGPLITAEYHYSGFGVESSEDLSDLADDSDFIFRLGRGDFQIVCRHAAALQSHWEISDFWSASLALIAGPADGSGLLMPSVSWNFSDSITLLFSGIAPFGAKSESGTLRSEYGAAPASLFLQANLYL
jgi:hypothetical protein